MAKGWPKARPELSEEQRAIYNEWEADFLGSAKPGKYGRISRFDHAFAARSYHPEVRTLEIGAGTGTHLPYEPTGDYVALEGSEELAAHIVARPGLSVILGNCEERLPFEDHSFDRVLAIHILEHLYDLPAALRQVARVLKPDGVFSVVIPCEGGQGYALGRRLTTKRTFERRYQTSYDWLIGYDHCNTAREVMAELERHFDVQHRVYWPVKVPSVHLNVVIGLELTPS